MAPMIARMTPSPCAAVLAMVSASAELSCERYGFCVELSSAPANGIQAKSPDWALATCSGGGELVVVVEDVAVATGAPPSAASTGATATAAAAGAATGCPILSLSSRSSFASVADMVCSIGACTPSTGNF